MQTHIFSSLKITLASGLVFAVLYTALVWGAAQFAPAQGQTQFIERNGQPVGAVLVGQSFTDDRYFWGRPSAVGYNAAGSGGSNKGPTNPDYLAQVQARIDTFLVHNPGVTVAQIPSDLVTASGSGLDPHISPQALNARATLRTFLRYPLFTLGVMARIHWQALVLWRKRVPWFRKPAPPALETTH